MTSFPRQKDRGIASAAVLLFAVIATIVLVANFRVNYAVNQGSDAFDTFHSQLVEKNGVAQIVKESILAVAETAPVTSPSSLQTEIQNRLGALTLPDGGTIALNSANSASAVPANPIYPIGIEAAASAPAYFAATQNTRALAGMGNLLSSLAVQGPSSDLGRLSFVFTRSSGTASNEQRTYTVNADLFSVPVTNVDVVAYGLPASGVIPNAAPAMMPGFFGANTTALVVTSNNPSNDATAYPDLFNPAGTEHLPYQFRNAASFSWNAYEYLWGTTYQDALIHQAEQATSANLAPPAPQGSVYDFSATSEPVINGVSAVGSQVTIDCASVTAPVVEVVDSEGTGSVTILGSAGNGIPFILVVRNTAGGLGQTPVVFSGNNARPVMFILENANVQFSNSPQIEGGLFLDPNTAVSGAFTWFGHVSFYGATNPLAAVAATVNDSPEVKIALASLAPRVLLVSTHAAFTTSAPP